jgi:hypothetical protein
MSEQTHDAAPRSRSRLERERSLGERAERRQIEAGGGDDDGRRNAREKSRRMNAALRARSAAVTPSGRGQRARAKSTEKERAATFPVATPRNALATRRERPVQAFTETKIVSIGV